MPAQTSRTATAALFVTNVLNGTVAANGQVVHGGTVTRLDLKVSAAAMPVLESITVIGSGFCCTENRGGGTLASRRALGARTG